MILVRTKLSVDLADMLSSYSYGWFPLQMLLCRRTLLSIVWKVLHRLCSFQVFDRCVLKFSFDSIGSSTLDTKIFDNQAWRYCVGTNLNVDVFLVVWFNYEHNAIQFSPSHLTRSFLVKLCCPNGFICVYFGVQGIFHDETHYSEL